MPTPMVNTFENIDTKFHNDQRKTIGTMYVHSFQGGFTFVLLFSYYYICIADYDRTICKA